MGGWAAAQVGLGSHQAPMLQQLTRKPAAQHAQQFMLTLLLPCAPSACWQHSAGHHQ